MDRRIRSLTRISIVLLLIVSNYVFGESQQALRKELDRLAQEVESRVIAWRRDIHQHPELSHREFRTAKLVAKHLTGLGMEVQTGIAKTGVIGVLRGDPKGPVVALRADMDALPVTEEVDLSFASKVRDTWEGQDVGVMHACGHDAHTAILMGVAEVLSECRTELPGTVKFIFQPAEELGLVGAATMIEQGALKNPAPGAIFGLHVLNEPVGTISYRSGGFLASGQGFAIDVHGQGGHGSTQWKGVNPIILASQVVLGLQTIVSSQIDLYNEPAVVSVCKIHGGDKANVMPGKVRIEGTIRFHDVPGGEALSQRIKRTASHIAESAGGTAEVQFFPGPPVTVNDPDLEAQMAPTFRRVAGKDMVNDSYPRVPGGDDFSAYTQKIPGLYFYLGVSPKGKKTPMLHSPEFFVDESALIVGVRALSNLAVDYLAMKSQTH